MTPINKDVLAAVAKLQASVTTIRRNRTGGEFDWTDLPAVLRYLRPKLKAAGLTALQLPRGEMVGAVFMAKVTTVLFIESGAGLEGTVSCPCPPDRLEYSACVTLLRRVSLMTMCGLTQREQERAPQDGKSTGQRLVAARQQAAGVGQ